MCANAFDAASARLSKCVCVSVCLCAWGGRVGVRETMAVQVAKHDEQE